MGLYQPPWKYSAEEVAMDLSFHLVYGVGVGAGYAALDRWVGHHPLSDWRMVAPEPDVRGEDLRDTAGKLAAHAQQTPKW